MAKLKQSLIGKNQATSIHTYCNLRNEKITFKPDEILATNKELLEEADAINRFTALSRKDKLKQFDEVKDCFREVHNLKPVYNSFGRGVCPIAYKDPRIDEYYDIIVCKSTMEILPVSCCELKQARNNFIGAPYSGKTTKCVSSYKMLKLAMKTYEGLICEVDFVPRSTNRKRIQEKLDSFAKYNVPDRDMVGEDLEPIPLKISYGEREILSELVAEAGEVLMDFNMQSSILIDNSVPVFVFPADEYLNSVDGISVASMELLESYIHSGIDLKGYDGRFAFIITKADLFQNEKNEHMKKLLSKNTLKMEGDKLKMTVHANGFDYDAFEEMQKELWAYIRETHSDLYAKLYRLNKHMQVDLYLSADINTEVKEGGLIPEDAVPYRADEFILHQLNLEGIIPSKKSNASDNQSGKNKFWASWLDAEDDCEDEEDAGETYLHSRQEGKADKRSSSFKTYWKELVRGACNE